MELRRDALVGLARTPEPTADSQDRVVGLVVDDGGGVWGAAISEAQESLGDVEVRVDNPPSDVQR